MKKSTLAAKAIVGATVGIGFVAAMPAANATSLIPNREGEIKLTNMSCIVSSSDCIDTKKEFGYSVTSLDYQSYAKAKDTKLTTYKASRLFVDQGSTNNDWGFGIKFADKDAGTNPDKDQLWFRPVAYDAKGNVREGGQLEIGRYLFDFGKNMSEIALNLFDVEKSGVTGAIRVNGELISNFLNAGPDSSYQSISLKNVQTLELQLGYTGYDSGFAKTGDGVRLAGLQAVPESSTTVSLGLLALAGMFGIRQRKKASKFA